MKEVFLALKPIESDPGLCWSKWVHDTSLIPGLMKSGWHVYSCDGFNRVTEVVLELTLEKNHGSECP